MVRQTDSPWPVNSSTVQCLRPIDRLFFLRVVCANEPARRLCSDCSTISTKSKRSSAARMTTATAWCRRASKQTNSSHLRTDSQRCGECTVPRCAAPKHAAIGIAAPIAPCVNARERLDVDSVGIHSILSGGAHSCGRWSNGVCVGGTVPQSVRTCRTCACSGDRRGAGAFAVEESDNRLAV